MYHVSPLGKCHYLLAPEKKITALCGKRVSLKSLVKGAIFRLGFTEYLPEGAKVCKKCKELALQGL